MRVPVRCALGAVALVPVLAACGGSSSGSNPPAGSGPVQHPASLVGKVGQNDAFVISLTDPAGKAITNLAAGTYKLKVEDLSSIHDFHITGSGVDDSTTVGEKTTKTFTITVKPGQYSFMCDPHASQMHGSFTVS